MKNTLIALISMVSFSAFAADNVTMVKGMHCADCQAAVESKVCHMEGIASCKVELVNKKKQLGKITWAAKEGAKIDAAAVSAAVSEAGFEVAK